MTSIQPEGAKGASTPVENRTVAPRKTSRSESSGTPGDSTTAEGGELRPFDRVYAAVKCVPAGSVASYGQVADVAEVGTARVVGFALAALAPDSDVPWHRVVNAKGEIRLRAAAGAASEQRERLEREKVPFLKSGRVDLAACRWTPAQEASDESSSGA